MVTFKLNLNESMGQAMSQAKEQEGNSKYKGPETQKNAIIVLSTSYYRNLGQKREHVFFKAYIKEGRKE